MTIPAMRAAAATAKAAGGATMTLGLPGTQQDSNHSIPDPFDSYSGWRFTPNGKVQICEDPAETYTNDHNWGTPNTSEGEYWEIKAVLNSGSLYSGASDSTGAWLDLDQNRTWIQRDTFSGGSARTFSITVTIREKANTLNSDSQTYTGSAHVDSGA